MPSPAALRFSVKDRDVSGEARDNEGRWTSGGSGLGAAMSSAALTPKEVMAKDPEHGKDLLNALKTWQSDNYARMQKNVNAILAGTAKGNEPASAQALAQALEGATPSAPMLYRGIHLQSDQFDHYRDDVFVPGKTVDIPASSFSSKQEAGLTYARDYAGGFLGPPQTGMLLQIEPGSRGINGEKIMTRYGGVNHEWVSGGRYKVVSSAPQNFGSYTRQVVTLRQTEGF